MPRSVPNVPAPSSVSWCRVIKRVTLSCALCVEYTLRPSVALVRVACTIGVPPFMNEPPPQLTPGPPGGPPLCNWFSVLLSVLSGTATMDCANCVAALWLLA